MAARLKMVGLRRMRLEELATKLAQIEEQANLTVSEYPYGLAIERQRFIVGVAKQLRLHIEDQLRLGGRAPSADHSDEPVRRPDQATGTESG